jgi:hypothetical protein
MDIPNVDTMSLEDVIGQIEEWSQGRQGVESVPNMLRHLESCLGALSTEQQLTVLLGLLKAFGAGAGVSVGPLVAALITSGALGGDLIPVEVEGGGSGLCSCPRCERNRARASAESKDMN